MFAADKAVLALGNFAPRHPDIEDQRAFDSTRYVHNPWQPGLLESLYDHDPLFIIGTGQTTVDLTAGLYRSGYRGRIVAISGHGLLPLSHAGFEQYPAFFAEIKDMHSSAAVFRVIRKHLNAAEAMGIDGRAVIDSLRPDTQALWQNLPVEEKQRFMHHLFRYWEIIRSRIPPESQAMIEAMQTTGQLEVIAGRIRNLVETESAMEVTYTRRGQTASETVRAARVINCTGPECDYGRIDHPLVKNMIKSGLIRPGPAQLGMDALPNGAIIGRDGAASDVLFTLGSTMRGVLWEVLAVPEIRLQAERLAALLLEEE